MIVELLAAIKTPFTRAQKKPWSKAYNNIIMLS
jgi:hypothetical protein